MSRKNSLSLRRASGPHNRAARACLKLEDLESRCLLTYAVMDLGTLGGESQAWSINKEAQVVGKSSVDDQGQCVAHPDYYDIDCHAFLWQNGFMQELAPLAGRYSGAKHVSDDGLVAGYTTVDTNYLHAFLWQDDYMWDLGTLGGPFSIAWSVNDYAQVVGEASPGPANVWHAFSWAGGTMSDLGTLTGAGNSVAVGINNLGQIVGSSSYNATAWHGVLWQDGSIQDLGTFGGAYSVGWAINDESQIVGYADDSFGDELPCIWQDGVLQNLGTLGGRYGVAYSINNNSQVVGQSYLADGTRHGFLWDTGTLYDLNDLIDPKSGWVIEGATGINDSSMIVGFGINPDGNEHAFLLLPDGSPGRQGSALTPRDSSLAISTLNPQETIQEMSLVHDPMSLHMRSERLPGQLRFADESAPVVTTMHAKTHPTDGSSTVAHRWHAAGGAAPHDGRFPKWELGQDPLQQEDVSLV